jgi:hypothetical protein
MGIRSIHPLNPNFGVRQIGVVNITLLPLYPWERTLTPTEISLVKYKNLHGLPIGRNFHQYR